MAVDTEQSEHLERRGLSRRDMIRASAIAGAAAWTAPMIIDSLSSPAAALSNCPKGQHAYVVLWSLGTGNTLTDRTGGDGPATGGGCVATAPEAACQHDPSRVLTSISAIGLNIVPTNISHNINTLSQAEVTLSLAASTCCVISNVRAHVHRFGAPTGDATSGDCPPTYCQPATSGGQYLQLSGGAYGTTMVKVRPNTANGACNIGGQSNQVHWGSPNRSSTCQASSGYGYTNGQPNGYMIVDLDCTGPTP